MNFSRQLAVFMKAGIPIMEALEVIVEETQNKLMKKRPHSRWSTTFERATRSPPPRPRHPEAFPNFYVGILESAELTGNLDTVLEPARGLHRPRRRRLDRNS